MAETYSRRISIYVDSGQALAAQEQLLKKQDQVTASIKKYTDAGKEIPAKLTKQLDDVTKAVDRQNKKISGELSPSLKDLQATYSRLNREINSLSKQDPGFEKKRQEVLAAKSALDSYRGSLSSIREGFSKLMNEAKKEGNRHA